MNPARAVRRFLPFAVALAIGIGAGAGVYALSAHGSAAPKTTTVVVPSQPASSTTTTNSLTQIYKEDTPGVVDIQVTLKSTSSSGFGNPFQSQQQTGAEGTGFVIDKKGDILTAEHVVAGASSIVVTFQDGSTAKASLVGGDSSTDSSVIHVDVPASKLHPLALGDSSAVQPGQTVVAIGSPFGLTETMTAGIVSAVNRTIDSQNCRSSSTCFSIAGAIQTDAAINHGNSGGPLIDVATNTVIGINDQIQSDTQDNAGIGFATPINSSKASAADIIAGQPIRHAYLGVSIGPQGGGATIETVVSGSPASKGGVQKGDVVVGFDGRTIDSRDALIAAVTNAKPGQTVHLTVHRGSSTRQLSVTLGVQPNQS